MKKIRIGNDFVFVWAIERGGLPEDLSSVLEKHLHLSVFGKNKRVELTEGVNYDITGSVIRIEVTPTIANILGTYKAEFHYILPDNGLIDEDRKCAVDVDAFQIVAKTAQADDPSEFSVTSDMAIAFKGDKGDKGDSAYKVWLEEGNIGTEDDYFAYLRQPAVDAGASISELEGEIQASEGLRVRAETARVNAEGDATKGRVKAENERVTAEGERAAAETARANAEGDATKGRVKAENERVTAEGERAAAETARANAEGDATKGRVKAENERVTAEGERAAAETARANAEGDATKGRVKAENERVTAEGERAAAETARANAEGDATKGRVKAENERVTAEGERVRAFEQMMGEADDKIEEMDTTLSTYDGRVTQVESDISQLAGDVSNISNQAEVGVFHPEEFDGYVDSNTGVVVTSGNHNALSYKNTGYIRLLKGLTISVSSKGLLPHIVVSSRESVGHVIDKTTSNTYTATEDCFVRINNDTRLNSSGISYSIHGIETLIEDIKYQIDEINIESIFGASDLSLLVGAYLGGRYVKLAIRNAFQKIELYNWSGQEEIYISYYSASQTEEGTSITLQFRDLKNGNRFFAGVSSVTPVDRGDGIGVITLRSYAYIRNSGDSSQQWSSAFPAGYLYVRMKYLPFLSGSWSYSVPSHNANYSTVGLRNITRISVANSVMQAQVASAQQVTVGSKTLTKRNPGWTDVNYYKLKEYDLGKLFNVSDSKRVSFFPRVIERIYPHVLEDSNKKLLLQGIVEDNFVWIDKDGKVYLSNEDSGASIDDVICDGLIPNIGEDIVDYKICNVLSVSPNRHILQVHAVRLVNSKYRVCAENYIYDNGIISYAFSFPYKDHNSRQEVKSIVDFRTNWQFSKHGNIIVISDYGSKTYSGTVWVSTDNGDSWKNIFRMRSQDGFPRIPNYPFINYTGEGVIGNHIHAAFYDPYRDSILVTTGDVAGTTENLNNKVASGIYECRNFRDDIGDIVWDYKSLATSTNYPYFNSTQLVGGVAAPNCQLFGTDAGFDNGIYRINDVGGNIENKVIERACIVYDVEDALVTNNINNMESDTRMLSNGLIISLFQDYNPNPDLDGNGDYPSKMIASYDGYIWDKLYTFPANGEVSWMAMAQESSKYLYVRTRGITAQSQGSGLPSGTYLTDEQIERCYLIKMTKPY